MFTALSRNIFLHQYAPNIPNGISSETWQPPSEHVALLLNHLPRRGRPQGENLVLTYANDELKESAQIQ